MQMIEIAALDNGAHRNQTYHGFFPDGWAVIPNDMECENFPFGEVEVEEVIHYRDKMVSDEDGHTEVVQEPYTVMTVTKWIAGEMPEPEPIPEPEAEPTVWDELDAAYREGVDSV